jgi:hypothetical protein
MLKYKRLEGVDEALATLAGGLFPAAGSLRCWPMSRRQAASRCW